MMGFSFLLVEHSRGASVAEPSLSIVHIIALIKQMGYLTPKLSSKLKSSAMHAVQEFA